MRKITFSADARLIEAARVRARDSGSTLNEEFVRWLEWYGSREDVVLRAREVIDGLRPEVRTGGHRFTRAEMNER